jgi:hypothetical protein
MASNSEIKTALLQLRRLIATVDTLKNQSTIVFNDNGLVDNEPDTHDIIDLRNRIIQLERKVLVPIATGPSLEVSILFNGSGTLNLAWPFVKFEIDPSGKQSAIILRHEDTVTAHDMNVTLNKGPILFPMTKFWVYPPYIGYVDTGVVMESDGSGEMIIKFSVSDGTYYPAVSNIELSDVTIDGVVEYATEYKVSRTPPSLTWVPLEGDIKTATQAVTYTVQSVTYRYGHNAMGQEETYFEFTLLSSGLSSLPTCDFYAQIDAKYNPYWYVELPRLVTSVVLNYTATVGFTRQDVLSDRKSEIKVENVRVEVEEALDRSPSGVNMEPEYDNVTGMLNYVEGLQARIEQISEKVESYLSGWWHLFREYLIPSFGRETYALIGPLYKLVSSETWTITRVTVPFSGSITSYIPFDGSDSVWSTSHSVLVISDGINMFGIDVDSNASFDLILNTMYVSRVAVLSHELTYEALQRGTISPIIYAMGCATGELELKCKVVKTGTPILGPDGVAELFRAIYQFLPESNYNLLKLNCHIVAGMLFRWLTEGGRIPTVLSERYTLIALTYMLWRDVLHSTNGSTATSGTDYLTDIDSVTYRTSHYNAADTPGFFNID